MTEEEFADFYRRSVHRITGQLYVMTGDFHEAQDVVQEAFVRAWNSRGRLDRDLGPDAWVRTVAWRLAVSRWRRLVRGRAAWEQRADPLTSGGPDPGMVDIERALRDMPARQRQCATLFYVCDLTVDQIAAETRLASGTVKTHLSRARARFADSLGPRPGVRTAGRATDRPSPSGEDHR
ncbi:SigE family RNA polymerase sigma factor [Streptomyces uncialis]|uniref:RNA polymerase n=1 Tax=Streptomyces uncialis TaxID=1048205 RepID=A0A1Q4V026_9ACTN|nr:SigE family RNA polymerase sigma factor [Streptomyces uncialis]MCX4664047.1 SigE family RNA polymerase sigma factor [Streptomyces uncialis]OKH91177.1 RNA polymerase [Streptomyces uncialis]WTE11074.1 SigE family RNA polymerase sigma factor [Streptomyces uncialis]